MSRAGGSRGSTVRNPKTPRTGGTKQSKAGSIRSTMTPLSEDFDNETLATELSTVLPRASYNAPVGFHSQNLTRFERYLEETQVEVVFRKLLHVLLNRPELPYNPYPGFYNRLRMRQEKFHLESEPSYKILGSLSNLLKDTYIQNLYTIRHHESLWGLQSILRVVNPDVLNKYRWLVENLTPELDDLPTLDGYSNQVMVALIGPCVFDGSLYTGTNFVQLRLEYLVTGPDVSEGISIFVNSLMAEIDQMFNNPHHFLMGVGVPAASHVDPDVWLKQYWEPDKIQAEKGTFLQRMSDAVIGNKYIYVDCIFLLDVSYASYVRGEKQYGFNFIEVYDEMREEGLSSFCEFPMASLHEGVFFDRGQAEAYVSLFEMQLDDFEAAETHEAGEGEAPRSPGLLPVAPQEPRPATRQSMAATARSANMQFSTSQQRDVTSVQRHVHGRLEKLQPRKVKIDGFRFGEERSTGPFAWQITTPIKANYQRRIAGFWRDVELFEILYSMLMLYLMDREAFDENLLVEIYRLMHGTTGRLNQLMEHNKSLRTVIQALSNTRDYPIIRPLLYQYKQAVGQLFLNPLVERSQDHRIVGLSICAKVDDMMFAPDMEFGSASHLQFTLRGLKNINLYLIPLMMELAEDSLSICTDVTKLIATMEETFPEDDPRPPTRYKRKNPTQFKAGQEEVIDEVITHGVEDEHIKRHETTVLRVKTCVAKDMSSQVIVKENVLMKYMLDCHIDDMWSEFLVDLAGGDVFPPNPFPRLISILRQCAMKMDLFFERASVVTEKMFNLEVKLEDPDNFVYHIPGLDAHGTVTSLMMLDTGTYAALAPVLQSFQQKSYIQKKGPYRVGICLALSGPCTWYGRMQPYLNEIDLHEHYYIQGPSGCQGEAIQLCAVIVHNHMVDMITKSGLPVMGVYFGTPSPDHWTADDIINKKKGFLTEFTLICRRKQPIYAKAYVLMDGWRYVTLKKHFLLHFLEDGEQPQQFYPDDPAAFYQSVFLAKDRAAFHYQNLGPPQGGDPMSQPNVNAVTHALEKKMYDKQRKCDWLNFYKLLLLRDLISQDQSHVADCWRVFHSMAGQVEYVTGMMEVLQDLVLTCLIAGVEEKQASRRSSRQSSSGRAKNPVEEKALTKMVMAFYQKLMYVCEARLTMAARSLTDYIENKLKSALEFDPDTGQPFLAIEDKSIFRLEEMKSILQIFQDILGGDARTICTEITMSYTPPPQPPMPRDLALQSRGSQRSQGSIPGSAYSLDQYREPSVQGDPYTMVQPGRSRSRSSSVASSMLDAHTHYGKPAQMMTIQEN